MNNLTHRLRSTSLLPLILLACTAAYGQVTPLGDTYTNSAAATTNYGAQKTLNVDAAKEITYIEFNLASVPTGASISQATLKLYVNTVVTAGAFELYAVNGPWTESGLTYSVAPALGSVIDSNVPITTADKNQYILIPMTSTVQEWLTTPSSNNGIALVAVGSFNATFDSKETATTSHPPELDIVFAGGGGGGITGIDTAAGSGLIGGGTSGTLNLSLTNTCAAKQVLQWSGSAWACAAAGTGTITGVTAGTDLTGGGTSGNVTLSLNTAATNGLYAQLGATLNTFTGSALLSGFVEGSQPLGAGNAAILGWGTNGSTGVFGSSDTGYGVQGMANSPGGYGVFGTNTSTTGTTYGMVGAAASTTGVGVYGYDSATSGPTIGTFGGSTSTNGGFGVEGVSPYIGVVGAVETESFSSAGLPYGVVGLGPAVGVYGASSGLSATGGIFIHEDGVWGDYGGAEGEGLGILGTADDSFAAVFGNNAAAYSTLYAVNQTTVAGGQIFAAYLPALLGQDSGAIIGDPGCGEGSGNMGLQLGQGGMSGCTNYTLIGNTAGSTFLNALSGQTVHLRIANADVVKVSSGAVNITGTLSATGTKNFRIDHPLDPANKYLTHAAIESSEVLNLYSGNATLDDSGAAVVQLPDWFEAINKDFRYQLTPIGAPGRDLYVAEEISGGHFKIAGGKAGGKVSWQVTGVRNDAWEKTYPMVVEADKGADRGHYLTPELYGQPASARIGYEAVPEGQQIVHHHRPNLLRGNGSPAKAITLPAPPRPVLSKATPLRHAGAQLHQQEIKQK